MAANPIRRRRDLEAEVEAARARFARTLDKLTDPATHEAMKNEVMGMWRATRTAPAQEGRAHREPAPP